MTISDEQLLALVDGECAPQERAALEARVAADADLARRYAAQRALRERLQRSFDEVLREPVPPRLVQAAAAVRVRRFWPVGLAAAACFAAGLALGPVLLRVTRPVPELAFRQGQLTADGALAEALSRQLASEQAPSDPVRTGISFRANTGEFCRTFTEQRGSRVLTGLACRAGGAWVLRVLDAYGEADAASATYSQAGSALSPSVARAVETLMDASGALDAPAEVAARARGWAAPDSRDGAR